jgi:hypothetical protein
MYVFRSRKFWAALIGLIAVLYTAYMQQDLPTEDLVNAIMTIIGVYIGSVAVEDGLSKQGNQGE